MAGPRNHGSLKGLQGIRNLSLTPEQFVKQVLDEYLIRTSPNYELYLMAFSREIRKRVYELEENTNGPHPEDNYESEPD